jgi:hypothetical protein
MFSKARHFFDKSLMEVDCCDFHFNEAILSLLQYHFGIKTPLVISITTWNALKTVKFVVARFYLILCQTD